jgi:uncharacterized membrane protein
MKTKKRKAILFFIVGVLFLLSAPFSCCYYHYRFIPVILVIISIILILIGVLNLLAFPNMSETFNFDSRIKEIVKEDGS